MEKIHEEIECYPTHELNGVKYRQGQAVPLGASLVPGGVNFSVYSSTATACTLVLYVRNEERPFAEIPLPLEFKIGYVFSVMILGQDFRNLEYGYRMDGPYKPQSGFCFDKNAVLFDPYAKVINGRNIWMGPLRWKKSYPYRSCVLFDDFDWEGDKPLEKSIEDLIIYETHIRSLTCHASSEVRNPGTFEGLREKIPYLLDLGINCVELMPIYEFDEGESDPRHPENKDKLVNYWGYEALNFFAPKAGYAAVGKDGMQVNEFKSLVKALHKNGIEVILDVVFNHTLEGGQQGPVLSFKGIDNKTYYLLTPEGFYRNVSGMSNTLNSNHPVVRTMVLDCLRHWASEYHIDGFRFNLAAVLGWSDDFGPRKNQPVLEMLAFDPVLAKCKLIAQAWEAGGLCHDKQASCCGRWAEWNTKYRNTIRHFLKGDEDFLEDLAQRVMGSPDLYWSRGANSSINFVTCHEGFTLKDLVSYNTKHNEANLENNLDGRNDTISWNCGVEGETDVPGVNELRHRQIKNALAILMVSQGVPMILMGDEMGRSQQGNNNAYCHDNEINWLDWTLKEKNADLYAFARHMIHFRHRHVYLRNKNHLHESSILNEGAPVISFHGIKAWRPEWSNSKHVFAFMLDGEYAQNKERKDDFIYVAMNMYWEALLFELPQLPEKKLWHLSVDTGKPSPEDFHPLSKEPRLKEQHRLMVGARSVIVLVGK